MGTNAKPADLVRLQESLASIRSDAGEVYRKSWAIVGHVDNNPLLIDVVCQVCLVQFSRLHLLFVALFKCKVQHFCSLVRVA